MSSLQSRSIEVSARYAEDLAVTGPRPAGVGEAPVASPVHELHDQLARLNAMVAQAEGAEPGREKFPGWVRVSLPLGMSALLWAGILWATGVLRASG